MNKAKLIEVLGTAGSIAGLLLIVHGAVNDHPPASLAGFILFFAGLAAAGSVKLYSYLTKPD